MNRAADMLKVVLMAMVGVIAGPAGAQAVVPADATLTEVAEALRSADHEQALSLTRELLQRQDVELAQTLYLHGAAQLGLADRSGAAADYLDAGLSFMRVVVFFPRSRYLGLSLMETGYVHQRIGRNDLAARLYERAAAHVDAESDPPGHARLQTLRSALPADPQRTQE